MKDKPLQERQNNLSAGVILILLGLLFLAGQLFNWMWLGLSILPIMAVGFIVWGIVSREEGFFIPGGIFAGLGAGIILVSQYGDRFPGDSSGAIFMIAFAFGWALIPILTGLFTKKVHWWPLIPGAVIGTVGLGLIYGNPVWSALANVGRYWPVMLILVGLYLLLFVRPADSS